MIWLLTIYSIIITLLFIQSANRTVASKRSEAILYNSLKAITEKYNILITIFKTFENTQQIKPLKRDIDDFLNNKEKKINKKLAEDNKEWIK